MDQGESFDNEGSPWANSSPGGDDDSRSNQRVEKKGNALPLWGNERTMNLNPLILTNIQSSHYFKVNLYELKTYHEVIDEIYYKVTHLEPWEKGSRRTAGQTGMCGGVRGVGAGGIVSTAYCLLYKLFTLKLTRKQVNGLLTHPDSPYIRGLGFMYIRYTQPPADLWDWYDAYLEDPEDMDVKAGGGQVMTIGDMLRAFLTKLEWYSTLFPRIPVPIQQKLQKKMAERFPPVVAPVKPVAPLPKQPAPVREARHIPDEEMSFGEAERFSRLRGGERDRDTKKAQSPVEREKPRLYGSPNGDRERKRGHSPELGKDRKRGHSRERRDRSRDRIRRDVGESSREPEVDRNRVKDRERVSRHATSHGSKEPHRTRDKDHKKHRSHNDFPEEVGDREHKKHRSHSDFSEEFGDRDHKKHRSRNDYSEEVGEREHNKHRSHNEYPEEFGDRDHKKHRSHSDFSEELGREKDRQSKEKHKDNGRSRHKHRS